MKYKPLSAFFFVLACLIGPSIANAQTLNLQPDPIHPLLKLSAPNVVFQNSTLQTLIFTEDFSNYTSIANRCFSDGTWFGPWLTYFNGYGCVKIASDGSTFSYLSTAPKVSTSISEEHATLVLGPSYSDNYTFEVDINTHNQQRTGSTPNNWEVGWLFWDFTDETHAYYFLPKQSGWELGKLDPAYAGSQRYLDTGTTFKFPNDNWYHIKIVQENNFISVYSDGSLVTSFTDNERPYTTGHLGLYGEDSNVFFDNIKVTYYQLVPNPPVIEPPVTDPIIIPTPPSDNQTQNNDTQTNQTIPSDPIPPVDTPSKLNVTQPDIGMIGGPMTPEQQATFETSCTNTATIAYTICAIIPVVLLVILFKSFDGFSLGTMVLIVSIAGSIVLGIVIISHVLATMGC